jgi:hypothetical protein
VQPRCSLLAFARFVERGGLLDSCGLAQKGSVFGFNPGVGLENPPCVLLDFKLSLLGDALLLPLENRRLLELEGAGDRRLRAEMLY